MSSIPSEHATPVSTLCKAPNPLDSPLEPISGVTLSPDVGQHHIDNTTDTDPAFWNVPHELDDSMPQSTPDDSALKISPFLTRHIPEQYNALQSQVRIRPVNRSDTKFCYRHHPDLKCRRQADEPTMDLLQNVRDLAAWER